MVAKPVSSAEFSSSLESLLKPLPRVIAVGVSGGPDSMALAVMLGAWATKKKIKVHAITVDHGLRKESLIEAKDVAKALVKHAPHVTHKILKWTGRKPSARLMEQARTARYFLIEGYCRSHKIKHLVLAHHMDDQAETFLFRLAKGSGLDGLGGMRAVQVRGGLTILRPLLDVSKDRLVSTCASQKISFINDPSNESARFARPRLRKAKAALEEEGLSSKRLAVTAQRLGRAREALEVIAEKTFYKSAVSVTAQKIVLDKKAWMAAPEEIALRVLMRAIATLRPETDYPPRMERVESLFQDMYRLAAFRKRTLGGLVFSRDDKRGLITLEIE